MTLFDGWLQFELTVGKIESPQNRFGFGAGLFHESLVQRKVSAVLLRDVVVAANVPFAPVQLVALAAPSCSADQSRWQCSGNG